MRTLLLCLLISGLTALKAEAQGTTREWLGVSFEAIDSKSSKLNFSQLFRWEASTFKQYITEVDFKTKLNRNFGVGMELRYILENDQEGAVQGNRGGGRVRFNAFHKAKFRPILLENRLGIQYFRRFDDGANRMTLRFRHEVTPRIRNFKHDPTLGAEIFIPVEAGRDYSVRYGLSLPFNFDRNQFELGYYFEQSGNGSNGNENQHIFSVKYKRAR